MTAETDLGASPPNRADSRQALDRVVSRMAPADVLRALETLEQHLAGGKQHVSLTSTMAVLKDPSASSALKLIGFFVQRSCRAWASRPLGESVVALRDLVWLRGRLQMVASRQRHPGSRDAGQSTGQAQPPAMGQPQDDAQRSGIVLVYQLCVGRTPAGEEIDIWANNFANGVSFAAFLQAMNAGAEAQERRKASLLLPGVSDGQFIQLVYESVLARGCTPKEIAVWDKQLAAGWMDRDAVLQSIFNDSAGGLLTRPGAEAVHDGLTCHIMGTGRQVSRLDWERKALALKAGASGPVAAPVPHARFHILAQHKPLVSAIASLYRGGRYIERFMENITSQSCFRDYAELVIDDAASPENESAVIERYCRQFKNIVYHRVNYRIGIYDAWNVGVKMARGAYCTNTNLDDLRRVDSLEQQAATLDNLPFVDVVYQDFLYTFDPELSVEEIARFGYASDLPVINAANLMYFNSPHNAPMWRKSLHDELGYFDVFYKSAGDYEFWMRCLATGKVFYKLNDPHVVYYQNPEGLSTRPGSRGVEEAKHILKAYGRRLVSPNFVMPEEQFLKDVLDAPPNVNTGSSRYAAVQQALRALSMRCREDERRTGAGIAAIGSGS